MRHQRRASRWPTRIGNVPLMPWRLMVLGLILGSLVHEPQFGLLMVATAWGLHTAHHIDKETSQ